jgi:hypothetical protein
MLGLAKAGSTRPDRFQVKWHRAAPKQEFAGFSVIDGNINQSSDADPDKIRVNLVVLQKKIVRRGSLQSWFGRFSIFSLG